MDESQGTGGKSVIRFSGVLDWKTPAHGEDTARGLLASVATTANPRGRGGDKAKALPSTPGRVNPRVRGGDVNDQGTGRVWTGKPPRTGC